ncbi:hypothetical protein [Pantoea vagans]
MRILEDAVIQVGKDSGGSAHNPSEQTDGLLSIAKLKMLLTYS